MAFFIPKSSSDWAAVGYLAGWKVMGYLPQRWALHLGNLAAGYAARNGGPQQLRRNLARVLAVSPEQVPQGLIDASMRSYLRYWVEAFRLPTFAQGDVAAQMDQITATVVGMEHLRQAREAGDPIVFALPHSGNWDMAGLWLVHHYGGFTTVAERLKPEVLFDAFVAFRESLGFNIVPASGTADAMERIGAELDAGGMVCLLADRDLKGHGAEVTFFGEPTTMPVGPARLAKAHRARLITSHLSFTHSGWQITFNPPIPTSGRSDQEITQDIARDFEAGIAAHPADWHMLQPLWLADRRR